MGECSHLERTSAYFDGGLAPADEAAAVAHLATCGECQAMLEDAIGIDVAVSAARRAHAPRRRWPVFAAGVAVAATAAVAAWALWPRHVATPVVAIELPAERALEARFTGVAFSAHRPLAVVRGDHAHEQISLVSLAELERRDDVHALVAAVSASGDIVRAERLSARLPADAASETDRAAVALAAGDLDRAIAAAYRALAHDPEAVAATWNLALAARDLGLPRVAKQAFERVVAAHEPGWTEEASRNIAVLERDLAVELGMPALEARATAMAAGGPVLSDDDAARYPSLSRFAFYDAAVLAPDRERLAALRPLAAALDRATGQLTANAALERTDPAVTAPYATRYQAIVAGKATPEQATSLIEELRAKGHGADDMRANAIMGSGQTRVRLVELSALTEPWHDPWFSLAVARERIHREFPPGDLRGEHALRELSAGCPRNVWPQRCGSIEQDLAELAMSSGRYEVALVHAVVAVALQRSAANPWSLFSARGQVAEIHRLRGQSARARAELEEIALAVGDRDCDLTRYAQIGQTEIAIVLGDWAGARRALPPLDPPVGCAKDVSLLGVAAAVDLARQSGTAADRALAERWLAAATTLAEHGVTLIGTLRVNPGASKQVAAPARAWVEAHRAETDPLIGGLRTWGLTTLIDDAASRGDWSEVFELVDPPDAGCRVVASADDEAIAIAIATPAGFDGERTRFGAGELGATRVISDRLARALSACPEIAVSARPPLHGRSDLLPPALPWWFAGDMAPRGRSASHSTLEVSDARPPDPSLPRLASTSSRPFDVRLSGDAATPARVLSALATASYAELHVHGVANTTDEAAAYLALSSEADGRFVLRADAVRSAKLTAAPLIVLAACRGAVVAPYLRRRWSLPDAFVAGGASAVVAAEVAIPDADARRIFDELHERIAAGEPVARAIAAIRAAEPEGSWARHLMVFR